MKVYLQGADGEEEVLVVMEPDPWDDTKVVTLTATQAEKIAKNPTHWWIRIVKG